MFGGDPRDFGGIEDWGARLLATTESTQDALKEGLAGAVDVAVVRTCTRTVDAGACVALR